MSKRLQQLEITSGKAARVSAMAIDGVALKANLAVIVLLVLVVIPTYGGVAII